MLAREVVELEFKPSLTTEFELFQLQQDPPPQNSPAGQSWLGLRASRDQAVEMMRQSKKVTNALKHIIPFIVSKSLSPLAMQNWKGAHKPSDRGDTFEMTKVTHLVSDKVR